MTLFASDNRRVLTPPAPLASPEAESFITAGVTVAWTYLRRVPNAAGSAAGLERARFTLSLHASDAGHARLAAWLERDGAPSRLIQASIVCDLASSQVAGLVSMDAHDPASGRVLALTIDSATRRVVYASSPLLARAGFTGGTYDPPTLVAISPALATPHMSA